eukprot:88391_1
MPMLKGVELVDALGYTFIWIYCSIDQYFLYKERKRKGINNNLVSVLYLNYLFWFAGISNLYYIFAGNKFDAEFSILLFPECIQQHIEIVVFSLLYFNPKWIRSAAITSICLYPLLWLAQFIAYVGFGIDETQFPYYFVNIGYFYVTFVPLNLSYITLYLVLKKRNLWDNYGRIAFWFCLAGTYISLSVSAGVHLLVQPADKWWVITRLGDFHFFYGMGVFANYVDSKNLPELNMNWILTNPHHHNIAFEEMLEIMTKGEEEKDNDNYDVIESILDQLKLSDWSTGNKVDILPAKCSICNKLLNIILSIFCILTLLILLILYFICIVIPLFLYWLIFKVLFVCWLWRNEKFYWFPDYYTRFIMKQIEDLSLYNIQDQGIWWNIRYFIVTFGDGLTALYLLSKSDPNIKLQHYRYRQKLSDSGEKNLFVAADGGLTNGDYNYALKHYSDPVQLHEYSTRYNIHPYVQRLCPLYSLGQNIGTNIHNFIREIHYNIDRYLLNNFEKHIIPNDLYIPLFEDESNKTVSADDAFVYSIATFYYKCFKKQLSPNQLKIFREGRIGLVSLGVIPNIFCNLIGYKMLPKKYWTMISLFRELMLNEFKNHYIPRMIIETAKKYGFNTKREFDYAINSFCIELCPGNADIGGVLQQSLEFLNKNNEYLEIFLNDPENFVLEALRYTGLPSSGRTVFSQIENVNIDGNDIILNKGQFVIHGFDQVNRCPYIFGKNSNQFDPKRENLKKDIFVFGNKEEYIRNKTAKRSCPLHTYAIVQLQELIARLYECQGLQLKYENKTFENSFELSDNKQIKYETPKVEMQVGKILQSSLDTYQKYILPPLFSGVKKWNKNPPTNVPGWEDKVDELTHKYPIELKKGALFDFYYLPKWDEDLERDKFKDFILTIFSIQQIFPVKDDPKLFNSNEGMIEWRNKNVIIPKLNVVWDELISDKAMSLFAFTSLGCLWTKKIKHTTDEKTQEEEEIKEKEDGKIIPKNAVYENDWTILYNFKVRDDLENYGAAAYFDENYNIIAIFVSHLNKTYYPRDKLWDYCKHVWKTSVFVGVTVIDHAGFVHVVESNSLVIATREALPSHHPFRRLLSIFTYRTIYINYGVKAALLSKNMLIQRISGYDFPELTKVGIAIASLYECKPLHERIDESMLDIPDEIFPINHDSKELYKCMDYLVRNYINVYYPNEDEFINDKYIISFYSKLEKLLKLTKPFSLESFIYLISTLAVSVTGYHELVGSVMDVAANNVKWLDTKIYKNKFEKLESSMNDFASTCIVVMLTGLKNPSIINDFSHVLVKNDKYEAAQTILENWQEKLCNLADEIEKRNQKRRIPFQSCNPNVLECSVSI